MLSLLFLFDLSTLFSGRSCVLVVMRAFFPLRLPPQFLFQLPSFHPKDFLFRMGFYIKFSRTFLYGLFICLSFYCQFVSICISIQLYRCFMDSLSLFLSDWQNLISDKTEPRQHRNLGHMGKSW